MWLTDGCRQFFFLISEFHFVQKLEFYRDKAEMLPNWKLTKIERLAGENLRRQGSTFFLYIFFFLIFFFDFYVSSILTSKNVHLKIERELRFSLSPDERGLENGWRDAWRGGRSMKVGNIKERCQSRILMLVVYFTTFFAPVQSEREGIGSLSFLNNRKFWKMKQKDKS